MTLTQGGGSSCQIFEEFSTALEAINKYYTEQDSTHYLDDFFFVDDNTHISLENKLTFDAICFDIGIPQAPDKVTAPSTITEFLGISLDSETWKATLPQDKLAKYTEAIQQSLQATHLSQTQLQSLVGKLQFASLVVPARAFLRRLIDKVGTVDKPYKHIKLTTEMKQDLKVWLQFLESYNGVTYFRALSILPYDHYNMGADASKLGFGATFKDRWIQEAYPPDWVTMFDNHDIGITTLELYPIYVLIAMFGHNIRNSSVLFHSDNQGVVDVINKQSSHNPIMMNIIRPLVSLLMENNIMLRSQHISGVRNTLCDAISRFQIDQDMLQEYRMQHKPEPIPHNLKSKNFKLK